MKGLNLNDIMDRYNESKGRWFDNYGYIRLRDKQLKVRIYQEIAT